MSEEPQITDGEVDKMLAAFNGNPRSTIKALLHDLVIMVEQSNLSGSRGFLRRDHRLTVGWGRDGESGPG